jgi:hypothetical protein
MKRRRDPMKPRRSRPWTVFVRDIGPTFTFATEAAARQRAEALTGENEILVNHRVHGCYKEVILYEVRYTGPVDLDRWVYRYGKPTLYEKLNDKGQWVKTELPG